MAANFSLGSSAAEIASDLWVRLVDGSGSIHLIPLVGKNYRNLDLAAPIALTERLLRKRVGSHANKTREF